MKTKIRAGSGSVLDWMERSATRKISLEELVAEFMAKGTVKVRMPGVVGRNEVLAKVRRFREEWKKKREAGAFVGSSIETGHEDVL
jgi:hypothetical protein